MTDQEIIELFNQRNEQAIAQCQDKYGHYCYSVAYNILFNNENSQECVNDTFLGAWNSIPPHNPRKLKAFLAKITRNLAIDQVRKYNADKRKGITLSFDDLEDCIPDQKFINEQISAKEIGESINQFLKNEKEINRKLFVCRYFYNESIEEISNHFHFSQSKVKMVLKRMRD